MITHIFSDLDGTLLNETGDVTETNAAMIINSGIPFSLVSARTPNDMAPIVEKLQLNSPQVAFNGGLIYRNESGKRVIISEEFIEWEMAQKIITLIQTYYPSLSFSFYDDDNWYTCKIDEGIKREESIGSQIPQVVEREVFFSQDPRKLFKIMLWIFDAEVMEEVKEFFAKLEIEELAFTQSSPYTLEITNIKAQKSKGIDYILSHYDLDKEHVAAFGDGHNDISMLEKVGHPVVMENASDEVKAYGRYITKTNLEDGVGYGIETYFLKK
ncbi:HAD family hydrolase [Vagococcus hydrophili]|uniref:HAD family hydrolase n=1 Tax=Vagococcus hydrophili TaxID=2714947 RepID=A0A6G8AT87_9ENTE|nr:HAD family hydrolase [Vagococcus hydrophili]QIL48190.1 HAD family hydrolase [Vagococcus hydrophili]